MEVTKEKIAALIVHSNKKLNSVAFPQSVPNAPNPLALSKWYKNELIFSNSMIDEVESDFQIQNTCQKGCSYCCNQLIAVTSSEMVVMKPTLSNLDLKSLHSLSEYVDELCNKLSDNGISINSPMSTRSTSSQQELQGKYFNLNLRCPLLNAQGECIVYDTRPSLCWSYRCYENPEHCKTSFAVPLSIKYDAWDSAVNMRLFTARKPSKAGVMVLPFALKALLREIV